MFSVLDSIVDAIEEFGVYIEECGGENEGIMLYNLDDDDDVFEYLNA